VADLTAAQKAKVVALSKKRMAGKGALLYLYDPVNDRCLPAVCDEQGYIKIDPSDLDTRYHKKDETIDVGGVGKNIINVDGIAPYAHAGGCVGGSTKYFGYGRFVTIYATNKLILAAVGAQIYADTGDYIWYDRTNNRWCFYVGNNQICYIDANGISFAAGKKFLSDVTIDDAKKLLWSDVNLYRSSGNNLKTDDWFDALCFKVNGVTGATGTFNDADAKVVTVSGGIITNLDT